MNEEVSTKSFKNNLNNSLFFNELERIINKFLSFL